MTRPNPGGITTDPLLRGDFRLSEGSPAIGAGTAIPDNGGKDYFGNKLKPGAPNIGAYAGPTITPTRASATFRRPLPPPLPPPLPKAVAADRH